MPDPLTLTSIGTVVLTEGVKFLYRQASELLKVWRGREKSDDKTQKKVPTRVILPTSIFEDSGEAPLEIHLTALDRLAPDLRDLRKSLTDYADGIEPVGAEDKYLLVSMDAVRRILEAIYQRPLVLKGEPRTTMDVMVDGTVDVETVRGHVAGVKARLITEGRIAGTATANTAEPSSEIYGVEIDQVGE